MIGWYFQEHDRLQRKQPGQFDHEVWEFDPRDNINKLVDTRCFVI